MILMYHKIHPETKTIWWVSPDAFYLQMLDLTNKKVVYLDNYDPTASDQCVITFDGVYENVLKFAVPILKRFGYPFELFIVGDSIGQNNEFDIVEPNTNFANKDMLVKMVKAGGRLQWHTRSHPVLTGQQSNEIYQRELIVPTELRELCPEGFKWFGYPHGKRDELLKAQTRKYFLGALACDDGNPIDIYDLPRITVVEKTRFNSSTISVIIPCYNYGHFAADAIESVLHQTYPPDEILFIDDASSDNSVEVAKRYEPLIRVEVNSKNLGAVENFKKAVQMTKGDYICLLGADNRFRSDYIEKTKTILDANPTVGVVYTHFALFGEKASIEAARTGSPQHPKIQNIFLRKFPEHPQKDIRQENYIHGSSMYKREAYVQAGGYILDSLPEDNSLFARMLDHGWKAKLWDEYALEYRQHSKDQLNFLKGYEIENVYLRAKVQQLNIENEQWQNFQLSMGWKVAQKVNLLRTKIAPAGSRRDKFLHFVFRAFQIVRRNGIKGLLLVKIKR